MGKLLKPTTEDINKLHAEINQYINLRFLVVMTAVSLFGVLAGFILASVVANSGQNSASAITPLISVVSIIIYIMLHILTGLLFQDLTLLTSYLRITGSSKWEIDYFEYENSPHAKWWKFGLDRTIHFTFCLLVILTFVLSLCIAWVFGHIDSESYQRAYYLNVIVFIFAIIYLLMSAFGKVPFRRTEKEWEKIWKKIDDPDGDV